MADLGRILKDMQDDRRHRDLYASPETSAAITQRLLAARGKGHDSVREIPAALMARELEDLLSTNAVEMQAKSVARGRRAISDWQKRRS